MTTTGVRHEAKWSDGWSSSRRSSAESCHAWKPGSNMRFNLEASPHNLRVIRDVPDGSLLRIRGRNGIGKTLFVRLLQLATGSQPYLSMPRAWETLRAGLGQCQIRVEGLKDGGNLELFLDPNGWPDHPEPFGEWLGAVRRNGHPAQWSEVPGLLRVFRVGGDESLVRSLSMQIRSDRERLLQQQARIERVSAEWDARLQPLLALLDDLVSPTWDQLARTAHDRRAAADHARRLRKEAYAELDRVTRARDLQKQLSLLQAQRPPALQRIQDIDVEADTVSSELARIEEQSARVVASQRQSRQLRDEISKAERLYRLRAERVQRRRYELAGALRTVGLHETQDEAAIDQAILEQRERLVELEADRISSDRAGLVVDLINSLDRPLQRAVEDSLGPEIVADLASSNVTVDELVGGLGSRRTTLEAQTTEEARELGVAITRTRTLLTQLQEVPRIARLMERAEDDLAEVGEQLEQLAGRLSGGSAESYRQLQASRASLIDRLTGLAVEKAELERQVDDLLSEGDEDELTRSLATLGFDESDSALNSLIEEQEQRAAIASSDESAAGAEADSAGGRLERLRRALALALERLQDEDFRWLCETGAELPGRAASPALQQTIINRLNQAASSVRADIVGVRNDHDALGVALDNLARRVSPEGTHGSAPSTRLAASVIRYYEAAFAQELAEPELRSALFDDGSEVRLNLETLTTTWVAGDGERRSRPLEAFSSGEHAFAYTRLQLENVNKTPSENKVVFLDEFGAYVARDRLDDLFTFVKNKAIGVIADQVVVILPLATLPRDPALSSALTSVGYFVEAID